MIDSILPGLADLPTIAGLVIGFSILALVGYAIWSFKDYKKED